MAAIDLSKGLDHGCSPEWSSQAGVGRIHFKCPVCESENIRVNIEGQYILNTGGGQHVFNIKDGSLHSLDPNEKDRRGIAMPLVCSNGHDFEVDISYECTYDHLHIGVTMSEYSYSVAYPDELIGYYSVENQDLMREHRERIYAQHMKDLGYTQVTKGGQF